MSDRLFMPPGAVVEHGPGRVAQGGRDELLGETVLGGPLSGQDVRMLLDRQTLERLLEVARASLSGRAVLHGVGFRQRVWRGGDGHVYQTLAIISEEPKAESTPVDGLRR